MKKICASLLVFGVIMTGAASAAGHVEVAGRPLDEAAHARVIENTTYVSLRAVVQALRPDAEIYWEDGQAAVRAGDLELTAAPEQRYLSANGRALYVQDGVRAEQGRTLLPVRVLARALDAQVDWDAATGTVSITPGSGAIEPARSYYDSDALYWLARIVSAESRGEPLEGKIAVGNVVLNRVGSALFPDTIYSVIFDERWGGQFEPVSNGTIYDAPTEESVLAAKLCLDGADTAGESLYFLAPALTGNHWTMENRSLVTVIGSHWFYR